MRMRAPAMRRCGQPRPSSPPASQNSTVFTRNSSVATSSIDVPAAARAETEMPVRSSPWRVPPPSVWLSP